VTRIGHDGIYLDHAATTTMRPVAIAAFERATGAGFGNASGHHGPARRAKNALEAAREHAAELLGAETPHSIVFTSGGTESDNLAITGSALAGPRTSIVVSAIEHKAVIGPSRALERFGYHTTLVPPDGDAIVHPDAVADWIDADTALVSVMAANNETGTIEPFPEIAERVRSADSSIVVHTDAAQYFVAESVDVAALGLDLVSLSSHKFGGPTGVGLLYIAPRVRLEPVLTGGSQEAGRRPGTSNVAGIVAMVAAMAEVEEQRSSFTSRVGAERDAFERVLAAGDPSVVVTAGNAKRLVHFSHVCFEGIPAETLIIRLDAAGVFAAAGSACQSGAREPSHVLTAMGMSDEAARRCVRFTFGWDTRPGDGAEAARRVLAMIGALR